MLFIKHRKDDRHRLKYLLPYGYMRRHLAKAYGYKVENGEFVKRRILKSDITGFRMMDILPLGVVMALQRAFGANAGAADQIDAKTESIWRDFKNLRNEFAAYKAKVECELERLNVECMRLQMLLNGQEYLDECHTSGGEKD